MYFQIWNIYFFYPLEIYHINYSKDYDHALNILLDCQNKLSYVTKNCNSNHLNLSLIVMGIMDINYFTIGFSQLKKKNYLPKYLYDVLFQKDNKEIYFEAVLRIVISMWLSDLYIQFENECIIQLFDILFHNVIDRNNTWNKTFCHIFKQINSSLYLKFIRRLPLIFYQALKNVCNINEKRQENILKYNGEHERLKTVPSSNDICESTFGRFKYLYRKMQNGHYETRQQSSLSILNASKNYINTVDFVCQLELDQKKKAFEYIFENTSTRKIKQELQMAHKNKLEKFSKLQEEDAKENENKQKILEDLKKIHLVQSSSELQQQLQNHKSNNDKIFFLKEQILVRKKVYKDYKYIHDMRVTNKHRDELITIVENCIIFERNMDKQEIDNNDENIIEPPHKKSKIDMELYCLCQRPYDGSKMISCDGICNDWYHLQCIGMTENEFEIIDKTNLQWICPMCK